MMHTLHSALVLSSELAFLQRSGCMCDTLLVGEGGARVPVHWAVLARSPWWAGLSAAWAEAAAGEAELPTFLCPGTSTAELHSMVEAAYSTLPPKLDLGFQFSSNMTVKHNEREEEIKEEETAGSGSSEEENWSEETEETVTPILEKRTKQPPRRSGVFPCETCNYKATTKGNLAKHTLSLHLGAKFSCEICGKEYKWKDQISQHYRTKHPEVVQQQRRIRQKRRPREVKEECSDDDEDPTDEKDKLSHWCNICDTGFSTNKNLNRHFKTFTHQEMRELKGMPEDVPDRDEKMSEDTRELERFVKNVPDYIHVDMNSLEIAFSYIHNIPKHERVEDVQFKCLYNDSEGVICDYKAKYRAEAKGHAVSHVDNLYYCTPCAKYTKSYYAHCKTQHEDKKTTEEKLLATNYYCVQCDRKFTTKQSLKHHNQAVHEEDGGKKYLCDQCDYKAAKRTQLRYHIQLKHMETEPIPCHICAKEFLCDKALKTHIRMVHTDGSFMCEYCNSIFKAEPLLRQHIRKLHMERKYCCDSCGKKYNFKTELENHITQVHTNIRDFHCSECDMKFSTKSKLKLHQAVHKEARFICKICGRAFRQSHSLSRHRLVHTGEKPYGCESCSFRCTQSNDLKKHYLNIHKVTVARVSKSGGPPPELLASAIT